jgi:Protein of unknown function (DUF2842)
MVSRMQARTRKLIGTIVLLVYLLAYALLAATIGAGRITLASPLAQLGYFLAAGLLWVVPAGLLIRWMQRPDVVKRR